MSMYVCTTWESSDVRARLNNRCVVHTCTWTRLYQMSRLDFWLVVTFLCVPEKLARCLEPVAFDTGKNRWHNFCSRSHAAAGQQIRVRGGQGTSTCRFPGCRESVYRAPATGQVSTFAPALPLSLCFGTVNAANVVRLLHKLVPALLTLQIWLTAQRRA